MSDRTSRLVTRLRNRLHRATRRLTWAELAFGAAVAAGTGAGLWLIATVLEATLWLGTTARMAMAATVATLIAGIAAALIARPLAQLMGIASGPSDEEVARIVGETVPDVSDRLVNLLQLAEGKRSHAPAPLVDEAVQRLARKLDRVSFDEVEDFSRARRAARIASLPLAGVLAFLLVAPGMFLSASERLLSPQTHYRRPAPFQLSVAPGNVQRVRGDSLRLTAKMSGSVPDAITLRMRSTDGAVNETVSLHPDSSGKAGHTVAPVRQSFQYQIQAPPLQTTWYTVDVRKRPLVRKLRLTVTPPSYTDLPKRTLDPNVGDVAGLPGSKVSVNASAGGAPVRAARLEFSDERSIPLDVDDTALSGSFRLRNEATYSLHLESPSGTKNRNPIQYQTSLQTDARPSVTFVTPEGPANLGADLTQTLRVQLSDDFGFSEVRLYYRLSEERFDTSSTEFSSIELPAPNPQQTSQELVHEWLLAQESGLSPQPGEVVLYYVRAWDNDTVNGPKSGRTSTQRLRRPSVAEQYEQLDQVQDEAGKQLERLRERADSMQQQSRQLRQELRRTREADWQDRRQLEQIQKKKESVESGVEDLSRKVEEMNRQMQKNQLSGSKMSEKFEELKRVIDEIKSPELQDALEKLKKAMENNDQRQMQRAMQQMQKHQDSYKEQLDRTLSLFKKLKAQQRLDEMARRAGELSERQKALRKKTRKRMQTPSSDSTQTADSRDREERNPAKRDSTAPDEASTSPSKKQDARRRSEDGAEAQQQRPDSTAGAKSQRAPSMDSSATRKNEDLAREQSRSAEQMKKLLQKMRDAEEEMKDVQSAPRKELKQMNRKLQREDLPQQMKKNSKQLQKSQLNEAQQGQQRMQKQLQRMQNRLSKMKSQMQGKQRQINVAGLRNALENTLRLSKRQEGLRTKTNELATEGPTLRSFARDQKTLSDGLRSVTDSLTSIARRVPEMSRKVQEMSGNALRAMETATTALDKRNAGKATGHQKTSMMHLNRLALLLSDLLDKLQNQQGSGSGMSMQQMMQQLQQMSGKQQKLNKQIQQQLNNTQGERLSREQVQRQKELARRQRRIKKELEEMGVGSDARDQILGDLQKIAEQMEKTAQQLEQGRHSRDLIDRQRQILTRLLNAHKSMRTQGKKEKRRGRESKGDYEQEPPGQLPPSERADQLRRDLIRALEMGYSPNYEELIKRYFDLLQQQDSTDPSGAQ